MSQQSLFQSDAHGGLTPALVANKDPMSFRAAAFRIAASRATSRRTSIALEMIRAHPGKMRMELRTLMSDEQRAEFNDDAVELSRRLGAMKPDPDRGRPGLVKQGSVRTCNVSDTQAVRWLSLDGDSPGASDQAS